MSLAYGVTALISLCMVGVCVVADKKRDVWLLLLFVSVSVCNLGYFMLAVSKDLSGALNSNRIAYLGSVFLPFFMLMMIQRFCKIKRNKRLIALLVAVGIIMLGITTSPGILPIYYSSVDIEFVNGSTKLVREYGPFHMLYYVYLIGYMLTMIVTALWAVVKKKMESRVQTVLLLCAVFCNIVIWLAEQVLPRGFEWLAVSYIISECLILMIYRSMQSRGQIDQEEKQSYRINVLLAMFLLLFANMIRIVTRGANPLVYEVAQAVVLMIYLGILVFWGVSVYNRIINRNIRRHLISMVGLMVFWMLLRTLRHTVFQQVFPYGQWCWYAFYISMILIPQICLFAAKYIGKPEGYRLPAKWYLIYIPSLLLIVGILTNDLHQQAFHFYAGYEAGWDVYDRMVLYYAAVAWVFGCIVLMVWEVMKSCRVSKVHKTIWMPVGMITLGVVYTVLYTIDSNLFGFIEVTAALCFIVVAIWESCIKTGLIQSNGYYDELLRSSGLGVVIADEDHRVHFSSEDARHLSTEEMKNADKKPIILEKKYRVSSSKIRGGHVYRQEDVSELVGILDELTELREELKDSNAVSMKNYQMDKQIRILAEKNRLHDELHRQTAPQINLLNEWLEQLIRLEDADQKKELLRRIVVVGAYLKRRNNLILVDEQDGAIKKEELMLSVQEIVTNLQLVGISCGAYVQFERDLPTHAAMQLFDFYEYVIESAFDGLQSMLVRFFRREERFYACIDAVCSLDLKGLQTDDIMVEEVGEGEYTLSFYVKGGVDR